jgi:hypothetical protein
VKIFDLLLEMPYYFTNIEFNFLNENILYFYQGIETVFTLKRNAGRKSPT